MGGDLCLRHHVHITRGLGLRGLLLHLVELLLGLFDLLLDLLILLNLSVLALNRDLGPGDLLGFLLQQRLPGVRLDQEIVLPEGLQKKSEFLNGDVRILRGHGCGVCAASSSAAEETDTETTSSAERNTASAKIHVVSPSSYSTRNKQAQKKSREDPTRIPAAWETISYVSTLRRSPLRLDTQNPPNNAGRKPCV